MRQFSAPPRMGAGYVLRVILDPPHVPGGAWPLFLNWPCALSLDVEGQVRHSLCGFQALLRLQANCDSGGRAMGAVTVFVPNGLDVVAVR